MKTVFFLLLPFIGVSQIPVILNMDLGQRDAYEKLTEFDFIDDAYVLKTIPIDSGVIYKLIPTQPGTLWMDIEYYYEGDAFIRCKETVPVNQLKDYKDFFSLGSIHNEYESESTSYDTWTYDTHLVVLRLDLADQFFTVEYQPRK